MNSFRLRLALLAGLITAALLVGAGFYAWQVNVRFNLDRLDRELRNLGAANLDRIVGPEHWVRVEGALSFVSGPSRTSTYILLVKTRDRIVYQSEHWPAGIDPAALPEPAAYERGITFAAPPPPPKRNRELSRDNPPLPRKEPRFLTVEAEGSSWRLGVMGNPYTTLVLGANLDAFNAGLSELRRTFLAALPIALLLVGGGAWFLAGRALRPVEALTQAAERITARGLGQRIAAPTHDREFQRLVTVFNAMMDRLEQSFNQATRFSADASHELKTPLALLQMELEQALDAAPPGSAQQQLYSSLFDEILRLKTIIEKLLLLSQADTGRLALHREDTDLSRMLANVVEDCAALAPGLQIEQVVAADVVVAADTVLLEQALQNLAGNAIKYNHPDGRIRFELTAEAGRARVAISNTGPGIAPEDRGRIFERFFRGDRARRRERAGGLGLGLSLSREIIRAHGGDLTLAPAAEGWTMLVATLPLTAGRT